MKTKKKTRLDLCKTTYTPTSRLDAMLNRDIIANQLSKAKNHKLFINEDDFITCSIVEFQLETFHKGEVPAVRINLIPEETDENIETLKRVHGDDFEPQYFFGEYSFCFHISTAVSTICRDKYCSLTEDWEKDQELMYRFDVKFLGESTRYHSVEFPFGYYIYCTHTAMFVDCSHE